MRRVILESPYAGDVQANEKYARECLRDSLKRGEAPIASHLLYTQPGVLDDNIPEERLLGINAGLAWGAQAEATVVYLDRGFSPGMGIGTKRAMWEHRPVEFRTLNEGGALHTCVYYWSLPPSVVPPDYYSRRRASRSTYETTTALTEAVRQLYTLDWAMEIEVLGTRAA